VVFPRTTDDVAAIMKRAGRDGVFVTPRGGGTGKSGGAVPVKGGLVMSLEKMNAIEEISREDFVAVVGPGVILQDLHNAAEGAGLFYPPDPASLDTCTLGGNVAENAGGPRAFKYGVTAHYVLGLEMVTAAGVTVQAGARSMKQATGYGVVPLMAGSEGTLAVFTRIILRLVPLPEETATCAATFSSASAAAAAVGRVLGAGVLPRVMEMMDRRCMDLMERYGEVHFERGAQSAVLIELDGSAAAVAEQLERTGNLLGEAGARETILLTGAVERSRFWDARRNLSEYVKRAYPGKVSDDICVPRGRMVQAVEAVYAAAERRGLLAAVYGHAGDGNLHVNFMSEKEEAMAGEALARDEVMRRVLELGGVVSGEHGIGTLKRKYLAWQQGRALRAVEKKIKKLFDPRGILNPGKLF